jgi:polysaccharide deacetylase family protein (PEP-CTERM system associated)
MDRIFDLLERRQQKATFFCLGWIAEKYPEVIKRIDSMGYEIGTHSEMHQLAYEQTPEAFRKDLLRSVKVLEDITGKKIVSYRAPGFSIKESNSWAFGILYEAGIEYDASIFPAGRAHGGFPSFGNAEPCIISYKGIKLREFPINTAKILGRDLIFSGGGYFRLLPSGLIHGFSAKSPYVMTYFHPRDFDAGQPVIEGLSIARRFKSYYGLGATIKKLDRWLSSQEFTDIRTAAASIDWGKVKTVEVL